MTTTIILKTHDWPVRVNTSSSHNHNDEATGSYGHGNSYRSEVVPKNSERTFNITDTTTVDFRELPADWTPESDRCAGQLSAGAGQALNRASRLA